jgi:hypothetical protein
VCHARVFAVSLRSTTYEPAQKFPNLIFLKELSFRTSDTKHAARVVQVRGAVGGPPRGRVGALGALVA